MIVITGASGNIGSKIAQQLLAQGKQVKAIARHADKLESLRQQGAIIETGDLHDVEFLTHALQGAESVFFIIPPYLQAPNIAKHQDEVGEAQIKAIQNSGIKNVIFLSSQGAQDIENTGVVAGVGRQEIRLNQLPEEVNVLNLRAAYFMENLFNQIGVIKNMGIIGTPLKHSIKMGMIATQDIASFAAARLAALDFKGKQVADLLGDRHYDHTEIASIIGNAIGKPDLAYVEFSYEDNKNALLQYGISESMADAFNGMYKGINEGLFTVSERNAQSTTPTRLEDFVDNVFKHAMN